ncbi:MAG: hypothetical protein K8S23_15465 [Candidatus Cloacimonetes bacterium]|nr:hypothetical protein [Candidatus Cloacimonadota bacterium]
MIITLLTKRLQIIFIIVSIFSSLAGEVIENPEIAESKMTIEEYKIVSADIATPDRMGFKDFFEKNIFKKREKWRNVRREKNNDNWNKSEFNRINFECQFILQDNGQWNK